jgi:hypothetical protein
MDAGDSGQQDLVNWFDEGTVRDIKSNIRMVLLTSLRAG